MPNRVMQLLPRSTGLRIVAAVLALIAAIATVPRGEEIGLAMWPIEAGLAAIGVAVVLGSARTGKWFTWSGSYALSNAEVAMATCGVALALGWVAGAMFAAVRSHL